MYNPKLSLLQKDWLVEATIDDMQKAMNEGDLTSRELVLMYLYRINTYDKQGVNINSIIEVNPDALHIAEGLDEERLRKGTRSALHGIPVLLKDNIDTNDKLHTSAGSLALKSHFASEDSTVAMKLREAGAIILGKANMTEWANFMTDNMPNGYSSRGGQVLNPYGPGTFDVGGSSSGSAAAVAANFAAVSIGTETSGSILSPASSNSIVGIKPTVGLISRKGIIPISHTQDTAGPMARTVKDAAYVLSVLSGKDEFDPATLKYQSSCNYTHHLNENALEGMRIGIARELYVHYLDENKQKIIDNAIEVLKNQGATIIDSIRIPSEKEEWDINTMVHEFKAGLNAYLNTVKSERAVHSLAELIEYNNNHEEIMLKFGQTLLEESEQTSGTLTEPAYLSSLEKDQYLSKEGGIDAVLEEYSLDAILTPNNFGAGIPAKAGYPSITVPGGYDQNGEPVGITFTASSFEEEKLIQISYAFEQATLYRKAPVNLR
jgi:amidase